MIVTRPPKLVMEVIRTLLERLRIVPEVIRTVLERIQAVPQLIRKTQEPNLSIQLMETMVAAIILTQLIL